MKLLLLSLTLLNLYLPEAHGCSRAAGGDDKIEIICSYQQDGEAKSLTYFPLEDGLIKFRFKGPYANRYFAQSGETSSHAFYEEFAQKESMMKRLQLAPNKNSRLKKSRQLLKFCGPESFVLLWQLDGKELDLSCKGIKSDTVKDK